MNFKKFLEEKTVTTITDVAVIDKLKETLISAAKNEGISLRSIETESSTMVVYFNYNKEAPEGFLTDKAEVREELVWLVKSIAQDQEVSLGKESFGGDVQKDVGTINFRIK